MTSDSPQNNDGVCQIFSILLGFLIVIPTSHHICKWIGGDEASLKEREFFVQVVMVTVGLHAVSPPTFTESSHET